MAPDDTPPRRLDSHLQSLSPAEGVERFLVSKENSVSPNTIEENRRKLAFFEEYCDRNGIDDLTVLTGRTLDGYRNWRRDESSDHVDRLSRKTMQDEMYLLSQFIEYLENIEAVPFRLNEKIEIPELKPGDGKSDEELEAEHAAAILDYLNDYEYATREHIALLIHWSTGRRPGGIHALDLDALKYGSDGPYLEFRHHEGSTTLKNREHSETQVTIPKDTAAIIDDYIEHNRLDIVDDYGREPLLTTQYGRLAVSTMRQYFYKWTRPCQISGNCPHGRTIEDCEAAQSRDDASKCPSSVPPYGARHGRTTQMIQEGVPKELLGDRVDMSVHTMMKHYDERSDKEQRQSRREEFGNTL